MIPQKYLLFMLSLLGRMQRGVKTTEVKMTGVKTMEVKTMEVKTTGVKTMEVKMMPQEGLKLGMVFQ